MPRFIVRSRGSPSGVRHRRRAAAAVASPSHPRLPIRRREDGVQRCERAVDQRLRRRPGENLARPRAGAADHVRPPGTDPTVIAVAIQQARHPHRAKVTPGMLAGEKIATRPHPVDDLQRQRLRRDLETLQETANEADDLVADHHHLE